MFVTLRHGRSYSVASLVLEAFVGPRPYGMLSLHFDDNPKNNSAKNLRWGSPRDNALDHQRNKKLRHQVKVP
jgi:hypothetical protein